jgi:hypothetical protein
MRVISQDGTLDIPYEQVVIQRFKGEIYFLNKNLTGIDDLVSDIVIAKYSTEEKAKKAMEMLREEYQKYASQNYMKVFQFPADEELE